jgi:sensor histidine kinase regulating citrate/malate metabolism
MRKWLNDQLLSNRSLRATLAFYFLPITVIPLLVISFYATRLFEESTREVLIQRALSERDAIVAEIDSLENELFLQAKSQATQPIQNSQKDWTKDRRTDHASGDCYP